MYDRLREYIDGVFSEAPRTVKTVEMKEEFLQNLIEKYSDLLADGKTEEAAFNIAVASIGDVSGIVGELQGAPQQAGERALRHRAEQSRRAAITAVSVALYILSVVPILLIQNTAGVVVMFIMVAAATGLLVFNSASRSKSAFERDTMVEEFQEWRGQNSRNLQLYKAISSAVFMLGLVIYFLVSFSTGAWHITWVIFPIIGAVNGIVKAIFDLNR